ncbi:protein of unknown function [Pseudomonas sp. JV551A1]|uniref:Uncharacterized protein n=1 Tax=Pseudomonas inefficax TaxID=2078786 RepID=A0AAQ1SVE5_9PSED|nr:protein of unknown function [Pseudomonas sp. JV551A1]SPO62217.1 protein of unknown function [Pseudomonas inefficax]
MVLFICKNITLAHKRNLLSFPGSEAECAAVRANSCMPETGLLCTYTTSTISGSSRTASSSSVIRPAAIWPVS